MKKLLFTLALLISFASFGQANFRNLLKEENITDNVYEYDKNGKCNLFNTYYAVQDEFYYGDYDKYINPIDEYKVAIRDTVLYFSSDDFDLLKENIDKASNKSVLKKKNNTFQFEFYNSDNLDIYKNPENLKRFIAQLDNKYIEKTDKYLKVINTEGRKKSHYEYKVNYDKGDYELNYFNDGYKEILSESGLKYELFNDEVLKRLTVCDGNKLIDKSYNDNGELFESMENFTEELDDKTEVDKELYTRFYPSGNRSRLNTYYKIIERLEPKYNRNYNNNNNSKTLEENSTMEVYSEDGIFSIKVVVFNYKMDSDNQLIKTEGIINGETINVYKISKNGEKEVYTTMEFKYNSKKHKKSLKRLLKKLNSF
jgi:hypothetical protein